MNTCSAHVVDPDPQRGAQWRSDIEALDIPLAMWADDAQ